MRLLRVLREWRDKSWHWRCTSCGELVKAENIVVLEAVRALHVCPKE